MIKKLTKLNPAYISNYNITVHVAVHCVVHGMAWHGVAYCFVADVFAHGAWVDLKSVEDPSLKDLAATLPSLVLHGKAPATIKKYSGAFGRWKKWAASRQEIPTLPAKPIHVALYLSYLAQSARTAAPLEEAVNALSWVHRMATVEDIMDHPIVVQVLAVAKRLLAHRTAKKANNDRALDTIGAKIRV